MYLTRFDLKPQNFCLLVTRKHVMIEIGNKKVNIIVILFFFKFDICVGTWTLVLEKKHMQINKACLLSALICNFRDISP